MESLVSTRIFLQFEILTRASCRFVPVKFEGKNAEYTQNAKKVDKEAL